MIGGLVVVNEVDPVVENDNEVEPVVEIDDADVDVVFKQPFKIFILKYLLLARLLILR